MDGTTTSYLKTALDLAREAHHNLQCSIYGSSKIEAMLILPLIAQAAKLAIDVDNLIAARKQS